MDIAQHKYKKFCLTVEQLIRHLSFWEGRGLVTSTLLW